MKLTPRQKVAKLVRTYLDLDDDGTQVTTLNANDVDSLITELTELVEKATNTK